MLSNHNALQHSSLLKILVVKQQKYKQIDLEYFQMSYASLPVRKQCPCSGTTSESYKPTFHGGYLSCNMSYGGAATIQVFRPLWWRYSYST